MSITQFKSRSFTVDGAINRPGVFPIVGSRSSLLSALASAAGFSSVADPIDVVVYRNVGGTKQAARFDAKAIRAGTAEDPEIISGDVIVADASGIRSALQDILPALPVAGFRLTTWDKKWRIEARSAQRAAGVVRHAPSRLTSRLSGQQLTSWTRPAVLPPTDNRRLFARRLPFRDMPVGAASLPIVR